MYLHSIEIVYQVAKCTSSDISGLKMQKAVLNISNGFSYTFQILLKTVFMSSVGILQMFTQWIIHVIWLSYSITSAGRTIN